MKFCHERLPPGIDALDPRSLAIFSTGPIRDGPSKSMYCPPEELDRMLDEYYEIRAWSGDGFPTPERLRTLGLGFAVKA